MAKSKTILEKLKKIKAHAESAEKIGNEEEAHAFASMLQKLLLKHKLSLSEVELAVEDLEEIGTHWIDWEGGGYKNVKSRQGWVESLASRVAKAYFCKIILKSGTNAIALVGRPSDVAVAEYVITCLVRTAEKISWQEYNNRASHASRNKYKVEKGFRASFLKGFITRLDERLTEELKQEAPENSTALVRVNNALTDVVNHMKGMRGLRNAARLNERSASNEEGLNRGRAVADGMNLKGNAMESGKVARRLA